MRRHRRSRTRSWILTLGGGLALCGGYGAGAAAAEQNLRGTIATQALYSQDIFRTGDAAESDRVASLRLSGVLTVRTARSTTTLDYTPEYFSYATFTDLDHLDQREEFAWRLTPGRRSRLMLRQRAFRTYRQSGFKDFPDDAGEPIVERTRRDGLGVDASWSADLSRVWRLETRGTYLMLLYDSPDLVDAAQASMEVTPSARLGKSAWLGGRLRGDAFRYSEGAATPSQGRPDRFLAGEVVWGLDGDLFQARAGAGAFRGTGPEAGTIVDPTGALWCSWGRAANRIVLSLDAGYASSGGLGETARSRSAELRLARRWGRGLLVTAAGGYLSRRPFGPSATSQVSLEGFTAGVEIAYRWLNGLGLLVNDRHVRQRKSSGTDLGYQEAAVALVWEPGARAAAAEAGRAREMAP